MSIFALSKMGGAQVIGTSSSDAKLELDAVGISLSMDEATATIKPGKPRNIVGWRRK